MKRPTSSSDRSTHAEYPWLVDAACRGLDADLFYPDKGRTDEAAAAKTVCRRCTVRAECLDYAMRNVEKYGIWGGFSDRERRALRRRLREQAEAAEPGQAERKEVA